MPNTAKSSLTPPGGHESGKPTKFRYIIVGLIVMLIAAGGVTALSVGIFDRPGPDQRAVEKAPAD